MLTDAHCHPFDLAQVFPGAEEERRRLSVLCAASATDRKEFEFNEGLAHKAKDENAAGVLPCFAIHPQMSGSREWGVGSGEWELLEKWAKQGRLSAVGETGFDLYDEKFKATEKIQDELFAIHLEVALRYNLPLVLHVRRAMHKVFAMERQLKKCKAVVFHSWPGTLQEGDALLKRGINAFFSFGTIILLNHHEAMRCCAAFPAERLLLETDAPYQPLKREPRRPYSTWSDLPLILESAAALRREAGAAGSEPVELEELVAANFKAAYG